MNIELTKKTKLLTAGKVCHEDIVILPVLQSKTVTENGVVVPDSGYVGLNHVVVNIPEKEDSVLGNIDKPHLPKLGRMKYFYNNRTMVGYKDIYPCNHSAGAGVNSKTGTVVGNSVLDVYADMYSSFTAIHGCEVTRCIADGKMYVGYPYTNLLAMWNSCAQSAAVIPDVYIPVGICVIALFDESSGVSEEEYGIPGKSFVMQYNEGSWVGAYTWLSIGCNYGGKSIIAAEFQYPKADITLTPESDVWEYSLDDGATFTAVTGEIVLKQAEHFMLRNTSATEKLISSDFGTSMYMPVYGVYALEAADGTKWVLS